MKKVYFACSISGGRDHAHVYEDIVKYIKASGGQVLSKIFADKTMQSHLGPTPHLSTQEIWERDTNWAENADVVIAEVTQTSLGVGYEIGKAELAGKPILALFYEDSGKRLSPMIDGNPNVTVVRYRKISETESVIKKFLGKV